MPDLKDALFSKVLNTRPPSRDPHVYWKMIQKPIFYQYQHNATSYILRKPRYIKWDGTQNQPILPFKDDQDTGVSNWTYRRNLPLVPALLETS